MLQLGQVAGEPARRGNSRCQETRSRSDWYWRDTTRLYPQLKIAQRLSAGFTGRTNQASPAGAKESLPFPRISFVPGGTFHLCLILHPAMNGWAIFGEIKHPPMRITDPAPVMSELKPRRNRGVRCIRFVGIPVIISPSGSRKAWRYGRLRAAPRRAVADIRLLLQRCWDGCRMSNLK